MWNTTIAASSHSSKQRRQLSARLRATEDASYGRRLLAILALDEGESASEVAERLGVTRQTVSNWARAFETGGSATALEDHYGGGRPSGMICLPHISNALRKNSNQERMV